MHRLKFYLLALVVGVVLPGLVFGLGTSGWLAAEMRLRTEREAARKVEEIATDIAEHIKLVTAAMKVLAESPALKEGDFAGSYQFAKMLSGEVGEHVGLATPDGRQVFNTRQPFGADLPPRADAASYTRALDTGRPSVSNVVVGAIARKPLVTIDVPVGTARGPMVLATSTDAEKIAGILARTRLGDGWKAAVVDGEGRFIARNLNAERLVGQMAVPEVIAVARSGESAGSFANITHEGLKLVSFFAKVPGTPWTVVIGTPEPVLLAPLEGPLATLAAAGALAIALTVGTALVLGRRLNASARGLSEAAAALGRGEALPPSPCAIAEFDHVGRVLRDAARLIGEKQAELQAARDAAERSVASKNRFIAAAGHDLRQPLQAAKLFLEYLRLMPADPRRDPIIDRLEAAQTNMANLVTSLLDVARIDAGSRPKAEVAAVADLLDEVVGECRPLAQLKGQTLRVRGCDRGLVIATDRMMFGRILRNLIHNAIRYTESGGSILVACRRRGGRLWVEVWDDGIGMAEDQLELIWEEFYQIDNAERDQAQGLGLGLAIVGRLARLLGYRVEVRSHLGRGSVFRFQVD